MGRIGRSSDWWACLVSFLICALACAGMVGASVAKGCVSCSFAAPWYLPLLGSVIWFSAAWVFIFSPVAGLAAGILTTTSHGSLIWVEWSGACRWCIGIFAIEAIVMTFALYRFGPRQVPVRLMLGFVGIVGGAIGLIAFPKMMSAGCPLDWLKERFQDENGTRIIIFMDPNCGACERLDSTVLGRYRGQVNWMLASRCTPRGRALMRRFEISSFPTLIVESNSLETVRARGVVAIENALRAIVKVRKV